MQGAPLLTVVVPNYNHARYLKQRVANVLEEAGEDAEVILLDDCSTDGSRAVMEGLESKKLLRIIVNGRNSGSPFAQWNKGVALGRGKYCWIAESDDMAKKGMVHELLWRLEENSEAGLAYCQSEVIDEDGVRIGDMLGHTADLDPYRWRHDYTNHGKAEVENYLLFKNTIPNASAVVFRRESYLRAGMADERYRLNGDWQLWMRLLLHSDIFYWAKQMNQFRVSNQCARVRRTQDGTNILEYSHLLGSLLSTHDFPTDVKKKALMHFMNAWDSQARRTSVLGNQKVLLSVLRHHPSLRREAFKIILHIVRSRMRIFLTKRVG